MTWIRLLRNMRGEKEGSGNKMQFTITAKNETVVSLARKIGYRPLGVDENNEYNIVRTLMPGKNYPRFHIYLKKDEATGEFDMNLHLDQKMPSYEGSSAHSGEYSGELVEKERDRIIQNFQ